MKKIDFLTRFLPMNTSLLAVRSLRGIAKRLRLNIPSKLVGLTRVLQSWRFLLLAGAIILLCLTPAFSQDSFAIDKESLSQGMSVIVKSTDEAFLKDLGLELQLSSDQSTQKWRIPRSSRVSTDLEFKIPADLPPGRYIPTLFVQSVEKKVVVSGSTDNKLTVAIPATPPSSSNPLITAVDSSGVLFPDARGFYKFTLTGDNLSTIGSNENDSENNRLFASQGNNIKASTLHEVCWTEDANSYNQCKLDYLNSRRINANKIKPESAEFRSAAIPTGTILDNPTRIKYENLILQSDDTGKVGIQIEVQNVKSNIYSLTLSKVAYPVPLALSAFVVGVFIFSFWQVLAKDGVKNIFYSLLVDKETNTYSLARLQFYLWTLVAVTSYLFLLFSRNLAQRHLEFIDIPSGLPGIVLISSATSFFAIGISDIKTKGGGEINPQLSDFITSGGNVVAERVQFLVWTIIGVLTYAFMVLFMSPASIDGLPTIPDGFLQLSGVSSVGYLGGKLARLAGPSISGIGRATYKDGFLNLTIYGRHLSKNGSFEISKDSGQIVRLPKDTTEGTDAKATIKVITKEDSDENYAKTLEIVIPSLINNWPYRADPYPFTIYNPDGSFARWAFYGPNNPVVNRVDGGPIKKDRLTSLTIIGNNFDKEAIVTVKLPTTPGLAPVIPSVTLISSTEIRMSVKIPAAVNSADLIIVNPQGESSDPTALTIEP
jgi:hypothetical protein